MPLGAGLAPHRLTRARARQVAAVERIRFFKGAVPSKARFHVTLGHVTVMAHVVFFGGPAPAAGAPADATPPSVDARAAAFSFEHEYSFQEELLGAQTARPAKVALVPPAAALPDAAAPPQAMRPRPPLAATRRPRLRGCRSGRC
jgi:hypothetical protein